MLSLFWDENRCTTEENGKWSQLRAMEWQHYPLYISQIFAPILMIFINFWIVLSIVYVISWLFWIFNRGKKVSLFLGKLGFLVHLKWPISIICGLYIFFGLNNIIAAIVAALYPIIVLILLWAIPPSGKIGELEMKFMKKFGYEFNK